MSMLLAASLAFVLAINFTLFCVAYSRQSDKLTDFAYALSFIAVCFAVLTFGANTSVLLGVVIAMVVTWALRLGGFLVFRIRRSGKDARFDKIRSNFLKFLNFWLGQGIVAWVLLLPLLMLAQTEGKASYLTVLGFLVWLTGLMIETVADWQKYRFSIKPANRNKWIDSGLWHYSLHPNYFGEILVWIGIYLTVYSSLDNAQRIIGLISPITIYIIIRFVSGVPLLEKSGLRRWGDNPKYLSRLKRTNMLIPFWPRRK